MLAPRRFLSVAALLSAALSAACAAPQSAGPSRDLRLRHVVLYQNGIGYFERTGVLKENRLRLRFREREIDDVLKSLVVVEEGLGPGDKPSTISALLPQADEAGGARDREAETWLDLVLSPPTRRSVSIAYAVPTAAWKATYRVLLPEAGKEAGAGALVQAWALVDNVSDEDWSGVRLTLATGAPLSFASDLRSPRFIQRPDAETGALEPAVRGAVLAERAASGDADHDGIPDQDDACPREPGAGAQDTYRNGCPQLVRIEASSIRILEQIFFERDADAIRPDARPVLGEIARALLDNPQIRAVAIEGHASSDERDPWGIAARRAAAVRSALVAAGVRAALSVKPYGDSRPIADGSKEEGRRRNRRVTFHIEDTAERKGAAATQDRVGAARAAGMARSPASAGAPQDIAGTVRYDITFPVSIPRRSSTLVTLINETMPGEDVLLYRPDPAAPASATFPFRAARLENRGDLGLQPGSVSIFAGGTFVGEGLLGKLNPGETALIPYALDSSTAVRVETAEVEDPVRMLSIARGVVVVENSSVVTTRYHVTVGRQAPARLFIRHARRPGYATRRLPPKTETTAGAHLIPLPVASGRSSELVIEEVEPRRRELSILDTAGSLLLRYHAGSALPEGAAGEVREIIQLRTDLGKLDGQITALREQLGDNAQRAAELRESLRAIERTPRANALQRRLMDRLSEATARGEALSTELADRTAAAAEARATLVDRLRDLKVEDIQRAGAPAGSAHPPTAMVPEQRAVESIASSAEEAPQGTPQQRIHPAELRGKLWRSQRDLNPRYRRERPAS